MGFWEPPLVSASGVPIWESLATAGPASIERAALARLLRDCRLQLRRVLNCTAPDCAAALPEQVESAIAVRSGEADALRLTISTARDAARRQARQAHTTRGPFLAVT